MAVPRGSESRQGTRITLVVCVCSTAYSCHAYMSDTPYTPFADAHTYSRGLIYGHLYRHYRAHAPVDQTQRALNACDGVPRRYGTVYTKSAHRGE